MAKITNPSRRPLTLATRHVVPRLGELITTNEVIQHTDNWPTLNAMATLGEITIELDADPAVTSPVYATDPALTMVEAADTPVYATDAPAPVLEPVESQVYATDPVAPEAEPVATQVYATDEASPTEVSTWAEPTTEPAEAVAAPVEPQAEAAPAKAKK